MKEQILVYVLLGSKSDLEFGEAALEILKAWDVPAKLWIASAHRSPQWLLELLKAGEKEGVRVYIAAAGAAAHLPGVVAAHVRQPVIGVPLPGGPWAGIESLLSIVPMPSGVPVAAMGLGKTGMKNAAYLAVRILALEDKRLARQLIDFHKTQENEVRLANQ